VIHIKHLLLLLFLCSSLIGEVNQPNANEGFGLKVSTYHTVNEELKFGGFTHIAFGPGGSEIITACTTHRFLYRNNPKESFIESPLSVKRHHSVVYNPADNLYYANDTDNHRIIAFSDPSENEITAETKEICGIKLQRPHDTVIDPETGWIYALNPNSGHIFRFTSIGENESVIKAPTQGYARALTFANGKLYAIGSSKGRIVEVVDWEKPTFKVYDSFDPSGRQGAAGSWETTGLVLNDAEFFNGKWYATSYFTKSYAKGTDFDQNKFIRFKTLDNLVSGNWTDLSSLVPSGLTPYFLTMNENKLYLATFNHESTGKGDSILEFSIH
jgi:DNA-binding beta-propeller fold protein YncE